MDNSLLLTPAGSGKDKKADTLRSLLSYKSRLDRNIIVGCISYRLNKPKNKDKDHKLIANKLVEVYNNHISLADRIEKFISVYKSMPEGAIHLMSNIQSNTDVVLLHDILNRRNLPSMMFRFRKAGREYYLDIKKPFSPTISPTRSFSGSSFQEDLPDLPEDSPGYQDPGYLDIMSFNSQLS